MILLPFSVVSLHSTFLPFSLVEVESVRVEFISATIAVAPDTFTVMWLAVLVRVATKFKLAHRTDPTLLQFTLVPVGALARNRIESLLRRYGSRIHSRATPRLTTQV